jgi:hypothetical protein
MIRLPVAFMAAVMACGSAFAQGRLPSPTVNNLTVIGSITGGAISGTDVTAADVTVAGVQQTVGAALAATHGSPGGAAGAIQTNAGGNAFGGITPGSGVAAAIGGATTGSGGLVRSTAPTITNPTLAGIVSVPAVNAGTLVSCIGITSGSTLATAACATGGTGGSGTVTSVTAGTGLSGGVITGSGTVAIAPTGVSAGSYTVPTLTVNAQGQITSATNGVSGGTVTSVIGTGSVDGLTLSGGVTTSGALTLGGALSVPLSTDVTGNLAVSHLNGGTGASPATVWCGNGTWCSPPGVGTLTSITAGAGLTGGTITGSGTISVAPTLRPIVWSLDDTTVVHNYVQPLFKSPWANPAAISSITYHVNGTGSTGSFVASLNTCTLYSGGTCTPVTNCSSITVSVATDTTVSCSSSVPAGQYLNLNISSTTGSPTSAWIQTVIAIPAT